MREGPIVSLTSTGIISSVGTITIDKSGSIHSFDAVSERLFGYAQAEVVGRNVSLLMPEPYRGEHDRYLARYQSEGDPRVIGKGREVSGQRKDGSIFPLWLAVNEVALAGQRLFVGSLVDLTEQKAVEADLARSLEVTRAILDTAVNPILTIDSAGLVRSFNPAAERLFGFSREEVLGHNVKMLMPEPYRAEHDSYLERYLREGSPHVIGQGREVEGRKRDGSKFPMHLSVGSMQAGSERMFVGIIADITERKQAEAELRRHRDHLEELVEVATAEAQAIIRTAASGIVTNDGSQHIDLFNASAERLFGWSQEEAAGRSVSMLMSEADASQYRHFIEDRVQGRTQPGVGFSREITAVRKDGSTFPAHLAVGHMELADHRHFFVAFLNNITEQKRFETQLKQAKEDAEAGVRTKAAFIANMSHEIRTPMNAILGFAEVVLQDQELPAESHQHVQIILNSARALLSLINDVLDVSKLESGKFAREDVPFHLPNALAETMQLVEHRAAEKGLELVLRYNSALPQRVVGDPTRIRQVLLNLLGNAIKFTDRGQVVLGLEPDEEPEVIDFSVSDTGIGMDDEQLGRIFRPFSQADASTTRRFGGTGLGTAISKQIVELLGGRIWAVSAPGQGSVFHFTVRLPEAAESDICLYDGEVAATFGYTSPRQFRILLAEDMEENAMLALLRLREHGHEVEWVKNGREAVAAMERFAPDIVLMDVMMPEMDGLEATRRIRAQESRREMRTPILALTASLMREDFDRCNGADMDGVEGKPIDFNRLLARMEKMVPAGAGELKPVRSHQFRRYSEWNWQPLAGIADYEAALRTWRDGGAYLRALRSFALHHGDDAESLERLLKEKSDDNEPARRLTHALKGVAGNLFLPNVADALEHVDTQLKAGDREGAQGGLPALRNALAAISQAIRGLKEKQEDEPRPPAAYDADATLQLMKELHAALSALDPERAEPLVARLAEFLPGSDLAPIQREIEAFDFEQASEKSEALAGKLGLDVE
ncbi:MAG TPA: PAS domain S-box protein [Terracidiphilus sp.]|nr:PAS domain S-box protein [Terracidiphilus sp.]